MQQANNELLVERYKWVLERKRDLNEGTFKLAATYSSIIPLIVGGQYSVFVAAKSKALSNEYASGFSLIIWFTLIALGIFTLLMIFANVRSWFRYRNEECDIEEMYGVQIANRPSLENWSSWFETYVCIFVLVTSLVASGVYILDILPGLKN